MRISIWKLLSFVVVGRLLNASLMQVVCFETTVCAAFAGRLCASESDQGFFGTIKNFSRTASHLSAEW